MKELFCRNSIWILLPDIFIGFLFNSKCHSKLKFYFKIQHSSPNRTSSTENASSCLILNNWNNVRITIECCPYLPGPVMIMFGWVYKWLQLILNAYMLERMLHFYCACLYPSIISKIPFLPFFCINTNYQKFIRLLCFIFLSQLLTGFFNMFTQLFCCCIHRISFNFWSSHIDWTLKL